MDTRELLHEISACRRCAAGLPEDPRPVLQFDPAARVLIAGQAPGRRVHASGIPFDDASGRRLREWMGVDEQTFYDARRVAILPMGFCYPGSGPGGDLPPRPECAPAWRQNLLDRLAAVELTLVLGRHAMRYHLGGDVPLTETVRRWREYWPDRLPLPHPSPRNNRWLAANPWFARELLPALRRRVGELLG